MGSAIDRDQTSIRVSVPARADAVQVVRSVVGGAAALLEASYDAVEDLRLIADEACALLLLALPHGTRLFLSVGSVDDRIVVTTSIDAETPEWPLPASTESLPWYVLSALADEATFQRDEGRPAVRFTKRLTRG